MRREGRVCQANTAFCQRAYIRPEQLGRNDSHVCKSENGEEKTIGRRLKSQCFSECGTGPLWWSYLKQGNKADLYHVKTNLCALQQSRKKFLKMWAAILIFHMTLSV